MANPFSESILKWYLLKVYLLVYVNIRHLSACLIPLNLPFMAILVRKIFISILISIIELSSSKYWVLAMNHCSHGPTVTRGNRHPCPKYGHITPRLCIKVWARRGRVWEWGANRWLDLLIPDLLPGQRSFWPPWLATTSGGSWRGQKVLN